MTEFELETKVDELARGLLSLAQVGGMPESYWRTDSRIAIACEALAITPEEAYSGDWWLEY